ncbi:putative ATP-dependent RNA helicase DHX35 [Triticum urartu]|uniref:Putative ATP-dependent RNA helicase DHX35 n=1 Tax=Triticum urartu TaxID=4572 RepID=M7ZAF6_TRIUA|nr:putative ATP-dependent RNA helicase DHX35 [Triticum urartu]
MSRFWRPGAEKPSASLVDDEEGGVLFLPTNTNASSSSSGQRLPVYKYRKAILYLVERHATTIIVGETGSGKSTQIPQYLKEAGWAEGGRLIGCTQPRRLAVQMRACTRLFFWTVASRVAEEVGVKLGEEVGYTIRFEDETNPPVKKNNCFSTIVKSMTSSSATNHGSKLFPILGNIMVYIVHEVATWYSLLPNMWKNSLLKPADGLPNPEPAILSVEGRGYTVETHYLEEPVSDYLQAAVNTVLIIHEKEPPGDILVFLTGQDDIDAALKLLNDEIQHLGKHYFDLVILPLYSGLPRGDQDLIFAPTSKGKRKVVISTNIAETSLTLEGVVYVVDSGFSKQKCYNPISDLESLVVAPISKASARQRAGRAGRVRPGKCFRLYTEEYYLNEMQSDGIPEMQRSNLVSCIIQLKALGIDNILGFDWPASPSPEAMIRALEILFSLGILDEDAKLTVPIGFQVAEMPLAINADTGHLCPFQATRSKPHQPAPPIDTASQPSIWQAGFRCDANGVVPMFVSIYGSRIRANLLAQDVGDCPRRRLPHHDYSRLHFCKRLFPGLEPVTSWSQCNSFTAAPRLPHRNSASQLGDVTNHRPQIIFWNGTLGLQPDAEEKQHKQMRRRSRGTSTNCFQKITMELSWRPQQEKDDNLHLQQTKRVESVWVSMRGVKKEFDEVKLRFAAAEGDHVTFLNIYKGFHQSGKSSQWCYKNFLNHQALKKVIEIRAQLVRVMKRFGIQLKSCDRDMQAVRKAIIAGSFANSCHLEEYGQNGMYKTIRTSQEVYIHPSSVLFRRCNVAFMLRVLRHFAFFSLG